MQLRLLNTPMNRGTVNRLTLGLTRQCVQVCVCSVWTAIEALPDRPRPSIAEPGVTCVEVIEKQKEKAKNEDIVSCNIANVPTLEKYLKKKISTM